MSATAWTLSSGANPVIMGDLNGTIITDGAVTASKTLTIDGFTAASGDITEGTSLTISGTVYTVLRNVTVVLDAGDSRNEATVELDQEITVADAVAVTITRNILSNTELVEVNNNVTGTTSIYLPSVAAATGQTVTIVAGADITATELLDVVENSADTNSIEGTTKLTLNLADESVTVYSDGIEWFLITDNR